MIKLSPREYAVYRKVWSLNANEVYYLDRAWIMKARVGTFLSHINTDEFPVPHLRYTSVLYQLEFLDCSIDFLRRLKPDSVLLLSFRVSRAHNLAICLVLLPHRKIWKDIMDNRPQFEELK